MKKEIRKESDGFLKYINQSPTPYHSTAYLSRMLEHVGAKRLNEEGEWQIQPDQLYYMVKKRYIAFDFSDQFAENATGIRIPYRRRAP